MPLYEYQCDSCGHRFEVIRKFSDPPLETCPKCGGHVSKLIASPAFQFKGSGWYITDYAKKDSGGGSKESKEAKESTASGNEKDSAPKTETTSSPASESTSAATKSPALD